MLKHLNSLLYNSITILIVCSHTLCLNITDISVEPSAIVEAPTAAKLVCGKSEDTDGDAFQHILWHKLVGSEWKLIKKFPPEVTEPQNSETSTETSNGTQQTADKPKLEFYELEGLTQTEDPNIELNPTSMATAGQYKCSVKGSGSPQMAEMVKEIRIAYLPPQETTPTLEVTKKQDNHISVKCSGPPSFPITSLSWFINYEPAPREDIHRLHTIHTKNSSYGPKEDLLINVEELRMRATKETVLNGNIQVVCIAALANRYNDSVVIDIPFDGPLYDHKCLSPAIIILIVIVVIVVVAILVAIVWVYLRKKKLNSLNKVAELFNKGKSITVLVENQTEAKVE